MTKADIGLNSWFSRRVQQTPDRPALTFEGTTRSYREMGDAVNRLATALKTGGVISSKSPKDEVTLNGSKRC